MANTRQTRNAANNPTGLYGSTKAIQRAAEVASRKLARHALRVAKRVFAKDEQVVPFLQAHAKREGSKSARVLLAAMREIGPKVASNRVAASVTSRSLSAREIRDAVAHLKRHRNQPIGETSFKIGQKYNLNNEDYMVYDFDLVGSDIQLTLLSRDGKTMVTGLSLGIHSATVWHTPRTWDSVKSDPDMAQLYGQYVFGLLYRGDIPEADRLVKDAENKLKDLGFNQWGVSIYSWPAAEAKHDQLVQEYKVSYPIKQARTKVAGASEYGLYGFKARTADLGLDACKEIRSAAGRIAADLHHRRADKYKSLTGFFKEHSRQARCAYSGLLLSCYPDEGTKFASTTPKIDTPIGKVPLEKQGRTKFPIRVFAEASQKVTGHLRDLEILPSAFRAFYAASQQRASVVGLPNPKKLMLQVRPLPDLKTASCFVNEDGRSMDVEGLAQVQASWTNGQFVTAKLPYTAEFEPTPMAGDRTLLASGDWIEWEE